EDGGRVAPFAPRQGLPPPGSGFSSGHSRPNIGHQTHFAPARARSFVSSSRRRCGRGFVTQPADPHPGWPLDSNYFSPGDVRKGIYMNKLITDPRHVVKELLDGTVDLSPGLVLLEAENVVVRNGLPLPAERKVAVLSG